MLDEALGARGDAGTGASRGGARAANGAERGSAPSQTVGGWAFTGVAVASFGGPLALAALSVPGVIGDAGESAGLATLIAALVFVAPLAIWLRYSRRINSAGGLYAFVEAAAGRRVALAQAAIWIISYGLYLVYTTVQIVYDLLPNVIPGERSYQTALAWGIPIALAVVMVAGRASALLALGLIAGGQLVLAGVLDAVTIAHITTPVSSFKSGAPSGSIAKASAQTSLLYICGSLPLFLGGELARPRRTVRRGLTGAYLATAAVIVLAVAPLAAMPGLMNTAVPGVTVAAEFAGPGLAKAIGIGVAVSIAGVMLCEYLAVTRLVHAVTAWRLRPIAAAIGIAMVLATPLVVSDPQGVYDTLLRPSLVLLWLSQLIVFAVYPLFARRQRQPMRAAWALSLGASALAVYGLVTAVQTVSS